MTSARSLVLAWAERGAISHAHLPQALALAGVTPGAREWRAFLDRVLLWLGAALLAAAAIFFVAYNWTALGPYPRFALLQGAVIVTVVAYWLLDDERAAGKAALLVATLLLGALLALFGQTYHTGADTWQLFATWALLILPWVLIARLAALWLLWIALVNVAIVLYHQTFWGALSIAFGPERLLLALVTFDTLALALWELAARRIAWLDERWAIRALALTAGMVVTLLMLQQIFASREMSGSALAIYPLWVAAAYAVYRRRIPDLFVLAGLSLSVIVVVTALLAQHMLDSNEAVGFLLIAAVVVALSAGAAVWLRAIAREQNA